MHNNTPIVPYISLCSGYEGIGLGLHRCIPNLRCIAYCEREAYAIANLVAKMEKGLLDAAPVFTDVTTFPWGQFAPYMAGGILSFGWPCQPVSMAGKRKATEDERWLFDIIADGISILKPGMLFAENVEGLLSAKMPDGSLVFSHCIERLERLHYKVEAGIFSAREVGAPHQRKRVFIMAHRTGEGLERYAGNGDAIYQPGRIGQESDGHAGTSGLPAWPSRPGESQYEWEPPRVTKGMAHTHGSRREEPEYQQANLPSKSSRGNSEAMGNSAGKRSCGGSEDGSELQPKMFREGYEAVADTNNAGREAGSDHSITSSKGSRSHGSASHCGNQEPAGLEDSNSSRGEEVLGNSIHGRHGAGTQDGRGQVRSDGTELPSGEALGNAESRRTGGCGNKDSEREGLGSSWASPSRNMGDPKQLLLPTTREHGAMDEASGIPTDGEGCESSQTDPIAGATRKRENDGANAAECSQTQPPMGRDADGPADWMDDAQLYTTSDNRTDELRLLGNGVVPATAERAFLTLLEKITK